MIGAIIKNGSGRNLVDPDDIGRHLIGAHAYVTDYAWPMPPLIFNYQNVGYPGINLSWQFLPSGQNAQMTSGIGDPAVKYRMLAAWNITCVDRIITVTAAPGSTHPSGALMNGVLLVFGDYP